jgi:hypothetical protein
VEPLEKNRDKELWNRLKTLWGAVIPTTALISGHRDPRIASLYTHLTREKVAEKLAKATI